VNNSENNRGKLFLLHGVTPVRCGIIQCSSVMIQFSSVQLTSRKFTYVLAKQNRCVLWSQQKYTATKQLHENKKPNRIKKNWKWIEIIQVVYQLARNVISSTSSSAEAATAITTIIIFYWYSDISHEANYSNPFLLQSALQPSWVMACSTIVEYSQQEGF